MFKFLSTIPLYNAQPKQQSYHSLHNKVSPTHPAIIYLLIYIYKSPSVL